MNTPLYRSPPLGLKGSSEKRLTCSFPKDCSYRQLWFFINSWVVSYRPCCCWCQSNKVCPYLLVFSQWICTTSLFVVVFFTVCVSFLGLKMPHCMFIYLINNSVLRIQHMCHHVSDNLQKWLLIAFHRLFSFPNTINCHKMMLLHIKMISLLILHKCWHVGNSWFMQ